MDYYLLITEQRILKNRVQIHDRCHLDYPYALLYLVKRYQLIVKYYEINTENTNVAPFLT